MKLPILMLYIERLKALLHSNPYCSPSSLLRLEASTSGSLKKHGDEKDNLHAITTPMVTSRLCSFEEEIASPVELRKALQGFRPSRILRKLGEGGFAENFFLTLKIIHKFRGFSTIEMAT
ncbi:hypothetical protein Tco_1184561 [Tanacetum coccineum]